MAEEIRGAYQVGDWDFLLVSAENFHVAFLPVSQSVSDKAEKKNVSVSGRVRSGNAMRCHVNVERRKWEMKWSEDLKMAERDGRAEEQKRKAQRKEVEWRCQLRREQAKGSFLWELDAISPAILFDET